MAAHAEKRLDRPDGLHPADLLVCLAIILATAVAFAPVIRFGFIGLDDAKYVYDNPHLRVGLSWATLDWIFLSFDPDNWFPVTRLSHWLDYRIFGLNPGLYHAENVVIHILAALLLFGFLRAATRDRWPCAFVAMVFAVHPVHVESVAWISERKDVLCALFWFATLWAWLCYTRKPGPARYCWALALFSLGLMSKPMIVTLPFLLVLLDIWPLRRGFHANLLREKALFALPALGAAALTLMAQHEADAIQTLGGFSLIHRLHNAVVSLAAYLGDTLWPARLWIPHPPAAHISFWQAGAAGAAILLISAAALHQLRARPCFAVGWFWFVGTLVPVLGLVQAGLQSRADRYLYVPMTGLALILSWGAAGLLKHWPRLRKPVVALAAVVCVSLTVRASAQTAFWSDSETLFRHAIDADPGNFLAWSYLGRSIQETSPARISEAISSYRAAIRIRPDVGALHNNLAAALFTAGNPEDGISELREAVRLEPGASGPHGNLGSALFRTGLREEGVAELRESIRLDPDNGQAHANLAIALGKMGLRKEADAESDTAYWLSLHDR